MRAIKALFAIALLLAPLPAQAAIALLVHTQWNSLAAASTSSAVDMTGATLIVVDCISLNDIHTTLTDSSGNTWTVGVSYSDGTTSYAFLAYAQNPTVSASQTFSVGAASSVTCHAVGFSGTATTGGMDKSSHFVSASTSITSIQPGSITPIADGALVYSVIYGGNNVNVLTIDSGMTILDQLSYTGQGASAGNAYVVQGSAAAINPTWGNSADSFSPMTALVADFLPADAPPPSTSAPFLNYPQP